MAYDENDLPFPRGGTYFGAQTVSATDGAYLEGRTYWVNDTIHATGKRVKLRIKRNSSGIALEAKRLTVDATGFFGRRTGGYANGDKASDWAGVVDDAYGTKTIPANDLYYDVVEGPCAIKNGIAEDAQAHVDAEAIVVSLTAATSQATTAGRITPQAVGGATTALANNIQHAVGRAMTARTSANTNSDVLTDIGNI